MSDFDALDDAVSDALDHGPLGEAFRLVPRAKGSPNGPSGVDPSRSQVDFVGTYFGTPKRMTIPGDRAPVAGTAITISAPAEAFAVRPRVGDLIERMATAAQFEVRRVRNDTTSRLQIEVALS